MTVCYYDKFCETNEMFFYSAKIDLVVGKFITKIKDSVYSSTKDSNQTIKAYPFNKVEPRSY